MNISVSVVIRPTDAHKLRIEERFEDNPLITDVVTGLPVASTETLGKALIDAAPTAAKDLPTYVVWGKDGWTFIDNRATLQQLFAVRGRRTALWYEIRESNQGVVEATQYCGVVHVDVNCVH